MRRVEIPIPNLPAGLEGMKIVQISDIHLSSYMPRLQVRRAVDMANDLGADLALVTGDFITGASDPIADCIDEVRGLRAPSASGAATAITRFTRARRRKRRSLRAGRDEIAPSAKRPNQV